MKIIVTGGDGFCGLPTSLHLSNVGHDVLIIDNLSRRSISRALQYESLTEFHSMHNQIQKWQALTGKTEFAGIDNNNSSYRLQGKILLNPTSLYHLSTSKITSLHRYYAQNFELIITDQYQGDEIQNVVNKHVLRIDKTCIAPKVQWKKSHKPSIKPTEKVYEVG